jgi:thiamine pyrophosphokinase
MRVIVFANGILANFQSAQAIIRPDDVLIAADGGARHCQRLGLIPQVVIGDFDSLTEDELSRLADSGVEIVRYPARKDFTDLELALQHAVALGAGEILILGALGARWDQTLANLLLPAAAAFRAIPVRLMDGAQEIALIRPGETLTLRGQPGDTVSLIPLGEAVCGVTTQGLEYPLVAEPLNFGSTRGISNVLQAQEATVSLETGLLLCVLIHQTSHP